MVGIDNYMYEWFTTNLDLGFNIVDGMYQDRPLSILYMYDELCNTNWILVLTLSIVFVMDRLQTSGELQDKTSFIDPSTGVDLLKGCSPDYLFL